MNTGNIAHQQARIAIIGAGLGGLSLARMLHVQGLQASVFDKDRNQSSGPSVDPSTCTKTAVSMPSGRPNSSTVF